EATVAMAESSACRIRRPNIREEVRRQGCKGVLVKPGARETLDAPQDGRRTVAALHAPTGCAPLRRWPFRSIPAVSFGYVRRRHRQRGGGTHHVAIRVLCLAVLLVLSAARAVAATCVDPAILGIDLSQQAFCDRWSRSSDP